MILQLTKGTIKIRPMVVPEPLNAVYVQYVYELGTNHLKPLLTIKAEQNPPQRFEGDRVFIDLHDGFSGQAVTIRVDLSDSNGQIMRSYTSTVPYMEYCIIGSRPVRPDLEAYIRQLESRIVELEEQGEVI